MKRKRILGILLISAIIMTFFVVPANAVDVHNEYICLEDMASELVDLSSLKPWEEWTTPRTTRSVDGNVPKLSLCSIVRSISLQDNDFVVFNCSYSPSSASLDFGVIAPDGKFYSINVKGGSINQTVKVTQTGNYSIAIRNNSSQTVRVVGFVDY